MNMFTNICTHSKSIGHDKGLLDRQSDYSTNPRAQALTNSINSKRCRTIYTCFAVGGKFSNAVPRRMFASTSSEFMVMIVNQNLLQTNSSLSLNVQS